MYLDQRSLLAKEKKSKAETLTRILSGPAEYYLDRDINTSEAELQIKYDTITREATSFKEYNSDIVKIFLVNDRGVIMFSTEAREIGKPTGAEFIKKCLEQNEEELRDYEYDQEAAEKKGDKESPRKTTYRAITCPLFLHRGNIVDILDDFRTGYARYHESDEKERGRIYTSLWKKYGESLGENFDPGKKEQDNDLAREIGKAGDIDFLFLNLFGAIMKDRNRRIKKGEQWMWQDQWLYKLKKQKIDAYIKDMPSRAKEINDEIISRLNYLHSEVESIRRLGAMAVIFNMDTMKAELNQTISRAVYTALIMVALAGVAFLFFLNFMIQNLKKL
jgi:hypothetical protein